MCFFACCLLFHCVLFAVVYCLQLCIFWLCVLIFCFTLSRNSIMVVRGIVIPATRVRFPVPTLYCSFFAHTKHTLPLFLHTPIHVLSVCTLLTPSTVLLLLSFLTFLPTFSFILSFPFLFLSHCSFPLPPHPCLFTHYTPAFLCIYTHAHTLSMCMHSVYVYTYTYTLVFSFFSLFFVKKVEHFHSRSSLF